MNKLETILTPEIVNDLLDKDELKIYDATDIYNGTKRCNRPLHFEYENGKWICVKGE